MYKEDYHYYSLRPRARAKAAPRRNDDSVKETGNRSRRCSFLTPKSARSSSFMNTIIIIITIVLVPRVSSSSGPFASSKPRRTHRMSSFSLKAPRNLNTIDNTCMKIDLSPKGKLTFIETIKQFPVLVHTFFFLCFRNPKGFV